MIGSIQLRGLLELPRANRPADKLLVEERLEHLYEAKKKGRGEEPPRFVER